MPKLGEMIRFAVLRRGSFGHWLGDWAWLAFLGWMAVVTAAYGASHFTGPQWLNSGLMFNVIGVSAVPAILVGARRNVPGRRLPWHLFALGQTLYVLGDVFSDNYGRFFGRALPSVSIADAFYLAFYIPLIAGLLLLIRERRGAQDHAGDTGGEPGFDRGHVADAATQLDGKIDRGADRLDGIAVGALAGKGAVQVHAMQPAEALGGKAFGLRARIGVEDGGIGHHAFFQADADAVLQIDGRKDDHLRPSLAPHASTGSA
jgi:hypothetical protein